MQRDKYHKDDIAKYLEVDYWIRLVKSPGRGALNEVIYQALGESVIDLIHRWE